MKILYALHPKSKPSNWQRSGDTNMASLMIKNMPEDVEIDVFSDFSDYTAENTDDLHAILDEYNISGAISSHPYIQTRTYLKASMTYIRSIADQYDVIHFHNATVASISWMNKLFEDCDTPLVYTMHTPPDVGTSFNYYHGDDYIKFAQNPKNLLVAVSPSHYDRVLKSLKVTAEQMPQLIYIMNGVDTEELVPEAPAFGVAVIGRLDISKDILHSLVAATHCKSDLPILYVGDTTDTSVKNENYYNEVVEFIEDNNIVWVKSATNKEVRQLLSASHAHIALSRIETFGLTVAESLIQGTPVIGFSSGGIGDMLEDGVNGKTVTAGRTLWKSRYREIADHYKEVTRLDCYDIREHALSVLELGIERCINSYVEQYDKILSEKGVSQ